MPHRLEDFKSALKGGGARPNLFEVTIPNPPAGVSLTDNFPILCKAANLPASNIASIDVPFRGRTFKVSGDRTYDPWSITVINDEGFEIRKAMETWMQIVGQYQDGSGATAPDDYMKNAVVTQFKRAKSTTGNNSSGAGLLEAAKYQFWYIFPTNISAIDLSYDSSDTIEEFTVEFQVQYWTPYTA